MNRFADYQGIVAETYDQVEPYRKRPDVAFYVEMAREADGPVLELGCGTGRILIPTARAGATIHGLDGSASMLAICREKLSSEGEDTRARVQLHEGDMRGFSLAGSYDLVTTPFRSFQHLLTVEDQLACLSCVRDHLARGGRLVLDLFNPSLHFLVDETRRHEFGDEPEITMSDGRRVLRRVRVIDRDLFAQINEVEFIYYITYPDGREERTVDRFSMRYLFRYEVEHLLARAGFRVEKICADFDRSPYGTSYPGELIVLATKG